MNKTFVNQLFARPEDVEAGAPLHVDLLRKRDAAHTVEFRRLDALWHSRDEYPNDASGPIVVWDGYTEDPFVSTHYFIPEEMNWKTFCEAFCVMYWAYSESFLPNTPE
jgi:hypothetical protein